MLTKSGKKEPTKFVYRRSKTQKNISSTDETYPTQIQYRGRLDAGQVVGNPAEGKRRWWDLFWSKT